MRTCKDFRFIIYIILPVPVPVPVLVSKNINQTSNFPGTKETLEALIIIKRIVKNLTRVFFE